MDLPSKTSSRDRGTEGEQRALQYLKTQGFSILERNYRSSRGEVDLIVEKGNGVYFVEVKLRRSREFGSAAESIPPSKRQKIGKAALDYVQRRKIQGKDLHFAALVLEEGRVGRHLEFFEFSLDLPGQYY